LGAAFFLVDFLGAAFLVVLVAAFLVAAMSYGSSDVCAQFSEVVSFLGTGWNLKTGCLPPMQKLARRVCFT
jgi:hypothetical protein